MKRNAMFGNPYFLILLFLLVAAAVTVGPTLLQIQSSEQNIEGTEIRFNDGGRYVLDISWMPYPMGGVINASELHNVNISADLNVYLGGGWDDTIYFGTFAAIVYKEGLFGDTVVSYYTKDFGGKNHDANKKNKPMSWPSDFVLPTSSLENGAYRIEYYAFLTPLGDSDSDFYRRMELFQESVDNTNAVYSRDSDTQAWFETFAEQPQIYTNYLGVDAFTVVGQEVEEQPEEPSEGWEWPFFDGFLEWLENILRWFL